MLLLFAISSIAVEDCSFLDGISKGLHAFLDALARETKVAALIFSMAIATYLSYFLASNVLCFFFSWECS